MTPTARTGELRRIAERICAALPPHAEEVVLTGSVSRGVADEVSDIEMLVVTADELELADCYLMAAGAGLTDLGSWGRQDTPTKRVSGYCNGAPIELIWWSRAHAETASATPRETLPVNTTSSTVTGSASAMPCAIERNSTVRAVTMRATLLGTSAAGRYG